MLDNTDVNILMGITWIKFFSLEAQLGNGVGSVSEKIDAINYSTK
jgi:hypothetical protein